MAMALNASTRCPHCGEQGNPLHENLVWFDGTEGALSGTHLTPPSPFSLEPLSKGRILLFAAGLLVFLALGMGPALLLPILQASVDPYLMLLSSAWALVCPYAYLRTVEDQLRKLYGDRALSRWYKLIYCPACDTTFIPEEPRVAPIKRAHVLLYDAA